MRGVTERGRLIKATINARFVIAFASLINYSSGLMMGIGISSYGLSHQDA